MGTCQSTRRRHHIRVDDPCIKAATQRKRGNEDLTDITDSSTAPLSPDSTLFVNPLLLQSPKDPFEVSSHASTIESTGSPPAMTTATPRDTPSSTISAAARPSPSSTISSPARTFVRPPQSRAYRSRLQKSRHLQQALYHASVTDDESSATSLSSYRFSMSPIPTTPRTTTPSPTHEFTSTTGNIWAHIEEPNVVAVALSRQSPSLSHPDPPLYLATATTQQLILTPIQLDGIEETIELPHERLRCLDFSLNGQYLAVGGDDCCVTLYALDSTNLMSPVTQLERVDRVYALQFSPDGRYLAVGGFDGLVAVYDATEFQLVAEIALDGLCFALQWSLDGQQLAFGGSDKRVSIVHVQQSWRIATDVRLGSSVQVLAWNRQLAVATANQGVAIVDSHGTIQRELNVPTGKNPALCWSPNGSYLVVASQNKCTLLETKSYAAVQEITRPASIQTVCWGEQAVLAGLPRRYLVIGDEEGVGLLKAGVELHAGDDVSSSANSYYSHRSNGSEWVLKDNAFRDMDELAGTASSGLLNNPFERPSNSNVLAVAFSRGNKSRPSTYFAYSTDDCLVTVLSTSDWKPAAELRFPKPVTSLVFTLGSRFLAFGCQDSKLYVSETGPNWSLVATTSMSAPIRSLMYSKDNSALGVGTADGCFSILGPKQGYAAQSRIDDDPSPVTSMDWTAKVFCIGREDGTVRLYDTDSRECVAHIARRGASVQSVAFGLSGRCLAVGVSDGHVAIYSAKGGWVLCHQFKASSESIQSVCWTPTGRFLAVGDIKGQMRLMDTIFWVDLEEESAQGWLSSAAASDEDNISSPSFPLAFSQDGKLFAFARSHSGVRVARTVDWKLTFVLSQADAMSVASDDPTME